MHPLKQSMCVYSCLEVIDSFAEVDSPHVLHYNIHTAACFSRYIYCDHLVPLQNACSNLNNYIIRCILVALSKFFMPKSKKIETVPLTPLMDIYARSLTPLRGDDSGVGFEQSTGNTVWYSMKPKA